MKPFYLLMMIIVAILALLGVGAFISPAYTQQVGYAEAFFFAGGLWFIASVVIVVSAVGFRTFAFYLGILATMAIAAFGLYGGFLVLVLTYVSWGFVFALQLLLVHHQVPTAVDWFRDRYTYKSFYAEYRVFYPMLCLLFFFLDVIPRRIFRDHMIEFDPPQILRVMKKILPPT
jgi:hypothetical protein